MNIQRVWIATSCSIWPHEILAFTTSAFLFFHSSYILAHFQVADNRRVCLLFPTVLHWHDYCGSFIPLMDFSLRRFKVNESRNLLCLLRAADRLTKSHEIPILSYQPTNDMTTIWLWLTSCHKKWYIMSWRKWRHYHLVLRELWVTGMT